MGIDRKRQLREGGSGFIISKQRILRQLKFKMILTGLNITSQVKNGRKVILDEAIEDKKKLSGRKWYSMMKELK